MRNVEARLSRLGTILAISLWCAGAMARAPFNPNASQAIKVAGPQFEVATVKPSDPAQCCARWWQADGRRFSTHNSNLRWLILWAYGLNDKQLVGAPSWMDEQRYDVSGVIDGTKAPDDVQWKSAMQRLLEDRFQLKFHHETREMAAFALTVAKGGPKLTKSDPVKDTEPSLGFNGGKGQTISGHGEDVTLAQFMKEVQRIVLDRPVVDRTGITGTFDLRLDFTREDSDALGMTQLPDDAPPNLISALNHQLGLKLESVKAAVDVMVMDHAEAPSAN
jgi:uncharacterized protein (TIGR03435 family)